MSQNRTAQWLLEAERHSRNGDRDSVLQILYKINEEKLVGEEKHTFYRLMSGCMLASVPAEMEQLYETMAYYEEMKDTANLRTMRSVLVSNHCYRNEYQKVDSLMHLLYQDFVLSGDSTGMRWCYSMKATIFRRQGVADSALHYIDKRLAMNTEEQQIRNLLCLKAEYLIDLKRYDEAEDYLDSIQSMAERANDVEYLAYLQERYRRLYHEQYRYDELMRMLHDSRRYMRRSDVAAHNMYRAQLHDLKHQQDSALQYYHLVACSENLFLATEAMYHLSQYYLSMGDAEQSYRYHQDVSGYIGQVFASYARQARDNAFKELKLTTEIDALKINRQQQVIVIVSLLFVLSLVSAGFVSVCSVADSDGSWISFVSAGFVSSAVLFFFSSVCSVSVSDSAVPVVSAMVVTVGLVVSGAGASDFLFAHPARVSRITAARRAASILFFIWYHLNQQDTDTFPKVQRLSENFA